jgi:hypothetical protein
MSILWLHQKTPFKSQQNYSPVTDGSAETSRVSLENSQDGLLEKEIDEWRRKAPFWRNFWRRYAFLIVANLILLGIYVVVLAAVASYTPRQCHQGPNLISCRLLCRLKFMLAWANKVSSGL